MEAIDTSAAPVDAAETQEGVENETEFSVPNESSDDESEEREAPKKASQRSNDKPKIAPRDDSGKADDKAERQRLVRRLKVNGKEQDVPIEELEKVYQKERAAEERFQEAASIRKQVDAFFNDLKQGNFSRLSDVLGKQTAEQLAEKILLDKIEYESLSDEQKELLRYKTENEQFRAEQEKIQAEQQRMKAEQAKQQAMQRIDTDYQSVFKEAGIKPTPRLVARMAEIQLAHLDRTGGMLEPKKAWDIVQRDMTTELTDYLGNMRYEDLEQVFPKQLLDRIRKGQVQRAVEADPFNKEASTNKSKSRPRPKKRMGVSDWFAQMEQKLEGY